MDNPAYTEVSGWAHPVFLGVLALVGLAVLAGLVVIFRGRRLLGAAITTGALALAWVCLSPVHASSGGVVLECGSAFDAAATHAVPASLVLSPGQQACLSAGRTWSVIQVVAAVTLAALALSGLRRPRKAQARPDGA
jgi:hypothetical protein